MKNMNDKALSRRAPVFYTEETASTNAELKRMAAEGAEDGTVLWAGRQTAGHGRLGRSFLSPEGGIYLSVLIRYGRPDEAMLTLTARAAVAVLRTLRKECGIEAGIKWPNDVLLHEKKLCGILTEAVSSGDSVNIIAGIGINLNTPHFPEDLRDIAGSVLTETGKRTEELLFVRTLVEELDRCIERTRSGSAEELLEYKACCLTLGKRLASGATAVRIEEDCSLILLHEDGTEERKFFGEILQ